MLEHILIISGIHPQDFLQPEFWLAVLTIIFIDLILSADNAIVIAMACRNLPPSLIHRGIILGTCGAILLRILFASFTIYLLEIPYIKIFAGLLLIWIAIKLISQEESSMHLSAPKQLISAIQTIIVADAIMSLDNILAIAGAAQGKPGLLWFGLAVSIPLMVYGSKLLSNILKKYTWLNILGGGIIGWIAGQMLMSDQYLLQYIYPNLSSLRFLEAHSLALLCAFGVILGGLKIRKFRS